MSQDLNAYQKFAQSRDTDLEKFSNQLDEDYIKMMNVQWEMFETSYKSKIKRDLPSDPIKYLDNYPKPGSALKIKEIFKITSINDSLKKSNKNILAVPEINIKTRKISPSKKSSLYSSTIIFFGAPFSFSYDDLANFKLEGASESDVSSFYEKMTGIDLNEIYAVLDKARQEYKFPDWPLYLLVKRISEQVLIDSNSRSVFQLLLMNRLGFDTKVCRENKRIILMLPIEEEIYGFSYVQLNEVNYYIMEEVKGSVFTFDKNKSFSHKTMKIKYKTISLPIDKISKSVDFSDNMIPVIINKNLIDLLNKFPSMHFSNYSKVPLSAELESSVIKDLKVKTANMSKIEAVNFLLKFVQTSFEYKTDEQQFGKERVLFSEEIFHYPYSDCEDRSILFSFLVKEILNLKVALINYPNHLATAVAINSKNISGDYFTIENIKFYVCDPTYINAPVGSTMPDYRDSKASIYLLD